MHALSEYNILIFLVQIFLLLGLSRTLGEIFRKFKQSPVTAELIIGIVLGPTIFGRFLPEHYQLAFPNNPIQHGMLETVAWIGVLFLLLETGLEFDFASAWKQKTNALKIGLCGVLVPMAIAFTACLYLSDHYLVNPQQRLFFCFFMSIVMSITALPVVSRVLYDLNLIKTDLGFLIISAHLINDILGWVLFTLSFILITAGSQEISHVLFLLFLCGGFVHFCLTIGRKFSARFISKIQKLHLPEPSTSLTFICLLGLFCGAVTQSLGINALFGFFIAGVMAGSAEALSERTRQVISQMVFAIFVPLFFTSIGLRIDFIKNFDWFLVVFITVISISGKFLGGWIGASCTKLSKADRLTVAIAHIPGGTMEVVLGFLALQNNLINEVTFVSIIFAAMVSSIIFGPWISYSIHSRKGIHLRKYFSKRTIISDVISNTRIGAIDEIGKLIRELEDVPTWEKIREFVVQREEAMGTAIEEGVAIPHARISKLKRPIVLFGRSLSGIDWNSPDGKLTNFIFLILVPEEADDVHLKILVNIAKMMSNEQIRSNFAAAKDDKELWDVLQQSFIEKT